MLPAWIEPRPRCSTGISAMRTWSRRWRSCSPWAAVRLPQTISLPHRPIPNQKSSRPKPNQRVQLRHHLGQPDQPERASGAEGHREGSYGTSGGNRRPWLYRIAGAGRTLRRGRGARHRRPPGPRRQTGRKGRARRKRPTRRKGRNRRTGPFAALEIRTGNAEVDPPLHQIRCLRCRRQADDPDLGRERTDRQRETVNRTLILGEDLIALGQRPFPARCWGFRAKAVRGNSSIAGRA
jgi:hypothetical protein